MKRTLAILAMVLVSVTAPVSAAAATGATQQEAYSQTHVSFATQTNAVVDYTVGGTETVDAVRVQSQSNAESDLGLSGSFDLASVASMAGAAVSLDTTTDAHASMTTDSGASIEAHDNGHGSLVVTAEEQSQYVALNLSSDASAEQRSDERVVFTAADGTKSTAMVVGEGEVSVTESGNLTASVEEDSRLVVRSYTESRTETDETEERMIVNGTAAASVYVMEQSGEQETDVVSYSQDTTVEVTERSEGHVEMTAERNASEGRVVITHVSESTFESAEDVQVSVDGEAAAQASSYAEVRQAANGGDTSRYMVRQSGSASAESEVVVGINHFSTREVTMTDSSDGDSSGDGSSDSDSSDGDTSDSDSSDGDTSDGDTSEGESGGGDDGASDPSSGNGPGFGVVAALVALVAAAFVVARR